VEKLIYLDALDDRRGEPAVREQNPLKDVKIKREEITPRTFEEYTAMVKRDIPEFAEIWSELWDEEFSHGVTINDEGIYVHKMPASIEGMIIENLITGYVPKRVEAKIPVLSFYGLRKRSLSNDYTEE
jgi:hypothetical protein